MCPWSREQREKICLQLKWISYCGRSSHPLQWGLRPASPALIKERTQFFIPQSLRRNSLHCWVELMETFAFMHYYLSSACAIILLLKQQVWWTPAFWKIIQRFFYINVRLIAFTALLLYMSAERSHVTQRTGIILS